MRTEATRNYVANQDGKLGEDSGVGLADGDSSWGLPHARWPGSVPPPTCFSVSTAWFVFRLSGRRKALSIWGGNTDHRESWLYEKADTFKVDPE